MTANTKQSNFETSLKELENIVDRMEHEELPLEDALKQFERGVTLTKHCQNTLQKAEQKVKIISQNLQLPEENNDDA